MFLAKANNDILPLPSTFMALFVHIPVFVCLLYILFGYIFSYQPFTSEYSLSDLTEVPKLGRL
jgi:hypothetical protein